MILTIDKWGCLDKTCNDYPLVVWRDFKTNDRALHQAVSCKVYIYHIMAGRLMGTVLYNLEEHINTVIHRLKIPDTCPQERLLIVALFTRMRMITKLTFLNIPIPARATEQTKLIMMMKCA